MTGIGQENTRPGNQFVPSDPSELTPRVPLIGRGPELRELTDALDRTIATNTPHAVTLIGSPGIGKSRLINEFLRRTRAKNKQSDSEQRVRIFRGIAHDTPGSRIIEQVLRARFGLLEGASPEATASAFQTAVTDALGDRRVQEFVHFLGAYLNLQFPESPLVQAVDDDPEQFGRVSGAVLRRFFEVDSQNKPTLLVFEDLHWASEDTLSLIHYLMGSLTGAPILIVNVARPDLLALRGDWLDLAPERHHRLELSPLAADDAASLMYHLLEPLTDPPEDLVDAAVEMASGSPYLLEQIVRAYYDSGTLTREEDGSVTLDMERLDDASLPLSVDDAISARISSLGSAERELLEMAATIGGVFWVGALVALGRMESRTPDLWGGHETSLDHLLDMLRALEERDYILELPDSTIHGEREFAFKHNLERETIRRLTSNAKMRRLHSVVAEWLEFRLAERAEEQCEMLAQHFERGGRDEKAAHYYLRAGGQARARYANTKAAEYYEIGLELLADRDVVHQVDALHHYGDVLQLAGRNDDALDAFKAMLDIAYRLDLKGKGGAAHNRIGRLYRAVGKLDQAMRHLGTGHVLFEAAMDLRGVASSLDDVGKVHWMRGSYDSAERFMRMALERREQLGDQRSIALSYNNLGLVYQDSGRFSEAQSCFQEALIIRRAIDDQPGIAQTLNNLGTIAQDNGEHAGAVALYREALEVAKEVGDRMRQAVILTNLGESEYRQQHPEEAIRVLKDAEEISTTLGDRILEGEILRGLAKAHMLVHELPTAREYIGRSVELFAEARGKPFLGVALRTQAEVFAAAGWGEGDDHRKANDSFERSIALFEELGNQVELAQSYETYANFLAGSVEEASGTEPSEKTAVIERASLLREKAEAIRTRLRQSDDTGLPALEGEVTRPGSDS